MNPTDFIMQYNKAIQNTSDIKNNLDVFGEEDDFDFMDFFGDEDNVQEKQQVTKMEEDDFAFLDDDIFENDEEQESTATMDSFIVNDTVTKAFIQSVTVKKTEASSLQTATLKDTFFRDLYNDDYDIVQGNIIDTFYKAFGILYQSEYSALSKYLHIYYGIKLDTEELQDLDSILNSETLPFVRLPYRNVTKGEILLMCLNRSEDYFKKEIFEKYSLEARDTNLLLQLMQRRNLNEDFLKKFSYDADVLNAYLYLEFKDEFDLGEFTEVIKNPNNINTFLEVVSNGPEDFRKLCTIENFNEIYAYVERAQSPEMVELVHKYACSPYLFEIIKAFSLGIYSKEFIHNYLLVKTPLTDFAAAEYGQGLLPESLLMNFKGNYYLTKCIVDMQSLYLDINLIKELISDPEKLVSLSNYMVCLLDNYHLGNITYDDYKRYLLLLGLQQNYKFIQTVLEKGTQLQSFNAFWFNRLLERYGASNVVMPVGIGDLIVIRSENSGSKDIILSVQDLMCRVHKVSEIIEEKLGADFNLSITANGIILYKVGLDIEDMSQKSMQLYAFARSSINNYLTNADSCHVNKFVELPSVLTILESNFVQPLQQYDVLEQNTIDLAMNIKDYMNYDKLLSLIAIRYPEFLPLVNSVYVSVLLKILQRIVLLPQRGLIHFNFLHMFFRVAFKNKYIANFNVTDSVFSRIGDVLLVETIGVVGYACCPLREILLHFDDYIEKLAKNSTRITLDLVDFDKIVVRRFE